MLSWIAGEAYPSPFTSSQASVGPKLSHFVEILVSGDIALSFGPLNLGQFALMASGDLGESSADHR